MTVFNRTYIIHMTTSVSRRLNVLCITFKDFCLQKLCSPRYVKVCILLTFGKHLYDRILSLSVWVWARRTIPHSIEIPVQSQKWSIKCVMNIDSISVIFLLYFRTLPTVLYILIFLLYFRTLLTVLYILIFLLYYGTLPTVLYILFFYCILELFLQCCIFWFFYCIMELFLQCCIFYFSIVF